ncbi:hypothetical protein FSP39_011067 [Pinctada imbricata]|uniref:Protein kinase domain-containing protein n=1 Tax=Pinctada imbricata TaxID=66713 RepID=A0AA88XWB0_PINIB|nr:hypothetical protein FSP39_011067 [Pinctada imbricata]
MGDDASSRSRSLQKELEVMQSEVEAVEIRRSPNDKTESVKYRPTYRAILANRGFLTEILSHTYCGSKSYAAPEILKGEPYDPRKADIWAIGVILYIFVTGKMPFDESKGNHGVLEEHRKLTFPWQKLRRAVSEECKSLILWTFRYDYNDRPDIYDILSSPWFRSENKAKIPDVPNMEGPTTKPEKTEQDSSAQNTKSSKRDQESR